MWLATVAGVLGDSAALRLSAALMGALKCQMLLFLGPPWCLEQCYVPLQKHPHSPTR